MHEPSRVRLVNDPTRVGVLTGREQTRGERRFFQVLFSDGSRWVPEGQIEPANSNLSPIDMLENKKLGQPSDLRRTLTHAKLCGRLADVIYSMDATNTDFYAYQFKPVVKILESPSNSILIADEVGLGKTIEAGLIWTELRSRFDMRRLLVLCPASLREKWRKELSSKMDVAAKICNAQETLEILQDEDIRLQGFAVIASIQGLRPSRAWEDNDNNSSVAKLARFLREKENEEHILDLLVIDEAHHLKNPETQTNELGQLCKNVAEYCVFLTATPIHNRNDDLFSLLHLLDPDTFTRQDVFNQILEANAPLVRARDIVLGPNPDVNELREVLEKARNHFLLRSNRQLSLINETDINSERLNRRDVRSGLAYRLETVNLLAHVVTRTRKRDVKEWRVIREPIAEFVDMAPVEEEFYKIVTDVVIEYALQVSANELFLLSQPQRQMTSSMAASLWNWQNKLIELEESEESGEYLEDEEQKTALGPVVTEIVLRSRNYVDLDQLKEADTKYMRLKNIIIKRLIENPREKILVFSAFRATLGYLAERLEENGVSCIQLMGGQRISKDETISRFRDPEGPSVLLSSEVGGEGVDLQFSKIVINYDLPWNPMRLEQRIGRIDRLGQEAEKVFIWNILYANTIDARIYQRLYIKLDLCRSALGDFEAILGDEIRRLEIDLLSHKLTHEEQERRIDQTAQALENRRLDEQQLEENCANLIAYGDYILNQVQAARELNRWISGDDIKRYIIDYLRLNYPGCELRQIEPDSLLFEVEISEKAKFDLAEFIKRNRLSYVTRLTSTANRPVRCRFENKVSDTNSRRSEEVISQFHPLVRMVSKRIIENGEQLTPAVALRLNRSNFNVSLQPGIYIVAVMLWSIRGLQDSEKLAYAATMFERPKELLDPEDAERITMAAVTNGEDWLEARNVVDLDRAYAISKDVLGHLNDEFETFKREQEARNEDRADIQLRTLEKHLQIQETKLKGTLAKHHEFGRVSLAKATEGRIRALKNRVEQQRLRIESRRKLASDSKDIALAVIILS